MAKKRHCLCAIVPRTKLVQRVERQGTHDVMHSVSLRVHVSGVLQQIQGGERTELPRRSMSVATVGMDAYASQTRLQAEKTLQCCHVSHTKKSTFRGASGLGAGGEWCELAGTSALSRSLLPQPLVKEMLEKWIGWQGWCRKQQRKNRPRLNQPCAKMEKHPSDRKSGSQHNASSCTS